MKKVLAAPDTDQRTGLVVVAHADDVVLFCGATVLKLVDSGWKIHVIRVTDDRWDSWGLDQKDTIERNRVEFKSAMSQLGVAEIHELNHTTDCLGDTSEVELRNQIVTVIRKVKPYLVMTFDPNSVKYEDNEDHRVVSLATNEACWTAGFDKHPDGRVDQLRTHLPIERWYFGRNVVEVTHSLSVAPFRERLINVISHHKTMLLNMVAQLDIQARFLGFSLGRLHEEVSQNPRVFAELIVDSKDVQELRVIDASRINAVITRFGENL